MSDSSDRASGELTVILLVIGLLVPVVIIGLGFFTVSPSTSSLVAVSGTLPSVQPQDVPKLVEATLQPLEFAVEGETPRTGLFPAQVRLDPGSPAEMLVEVHPRGAGMGLIFFRTPATPGSSKFPFVHVEYYGHVDPEVMSRIASGGVSGGAAVSELGGDVNRDILLAAQMLQDKLGLEGNSTVQLKRVVAGADYGNSSLDAVVALGVMAPNGPHPTEIQVDLKVDGETAYSALVEVAEWGGEVRAIEIDTAFDLYRYSDPSSRSRRSAFATVEKGSVVSVECADPRLRAYALLEEAESWGE